MKITSPLWIKLLGIVSAIAIITEFVINAHSWAGKDILPYLILCLLPAFASVFITLAGRYWVSFAFGIWFLLIGFAYSSFNNKRFSTDDAIFFLAAITMTSLPVLNHIFGQNHNNDIGSKINSEQDK
jgi:hypothetical protein